MSHGSVLTKFVSARRMRLWRLRSHGGKRMQNYVDSVNTGKPFVAHSASPKLRLSLNLQTSAICSLNRNP